MSHFELLNVKLYATYTLPQETELKVLAGLRAAKNHQKKISSLLSNGQNIHKYPVYHKTAATASHWRDNYIHAGMNHPYMYIVPT